MGVTQGRWTLERTQEVGQNAGPYTGRGALHKTLHRALRAGLDAEQDAGRYTERWALHNKGHSLERTSGRTLDVELAAG